MCFDKPTDYMTLAVKRLLDAGIPAVKLADFSLADDEVQRDVVQSASGDVVLYRSIACLGNILLAAIRGEEAGNEEGPPER